MKGLKMIRYYLEEILDGIKNNDVRKYNTKYRGEVALIDSKTKQIIGTVELIDVREISKCEYINWHCTGKFKDLKYTETTNERYFSFDFVNPKKLVKPLKINVNQSGLIQISDEIKENFVYQIKLF